VNRRGGVLLSSRRRTGGGTGTTWQQQRDALVPGTYWPGPTTTGVSPDFDSTKTVVTSASQTVVSDSGVVSAGFQPGQVYSRYEIAFIYDPVNSSTPIEFRNCSFIGPTSYSGGAVGLLKLYDSGHAPIRLFDCRIRAQAPHPLINGLHGYRFYARRCDLSLVADAVSTFSRSGDVNGQIDVDFQQSWIHELVWFSRSAAAAIGATISTADGLHCDLWQHQGGAGAIFKHNTLEGYTHANYKNTYYDNSGRVNAVVMCKPDDGLITNMQFENNLISGGRAGVNFAHDNPDRYLGNVGTCKNNRFVRDSAIASIVDTVAPFVCDFGSGDTANRYVDDNSVVPVA
jgi:hypothetical protein